jgi:hypothetical protein
MVADFFLILAALLLYITLQGLDWISFWNALRFGHYEFLLLTIPITSINYFIRVVRWSVVER